MAVRTFSIKFLGEVADLQKKAGMAKSSLEDVQRAATSPGLINAMGRMSNIGDNLQKAGGKVSDFGGSLSRKITAPVAGAVGAVAGLTAALGFKRLVGIDTARAQFQGLGYDADEVMKQVGDGVNNTALAMADGAALATGILATGAVPMNKLEDSIKRVANVSAAYGIESNHAGQLLNKVLTKGKVEYGDLSQMQENGIPIISQLAKHYGTTGDKIQKMAQDGKISIEDLNTVIDKNAGKAAEEYGKSWQGVTANIRSNLGKIGAKALGGAFEIVKEKAAGLLELLRSDDLSEWAERAGTAMGTFMTDTIEKVEKLIGWWNDLSPAMKKFAGVVAGVAVAAGPFLVVLGKVTTIAGTLFTVVPKLVAVISAIASPVGLVVAAVALLVAGLVWFFTKTETGQKIIKTAWDGIKTAISAVSEWWTSTAMPALVGGWDKIKSAAKVVADWYIGTLQPVLVSVWERVKDAAASAADWYQQHLAPVFQAFGELVRAVMETWVRPALGKIGELVEWLAGKWSEEWTRIKKVWDVIGPPLIAFIKGGFEGLLIVLRTIWNSIKIHVETVLGVIKGIIKTVTALIKGDWSGAWTAIKETHKVIIDGIRRQVENVIGGVRDWLANAWTTIKNTAKAAWGGVRDDVMGVINPLKDRMIDAFVKAKDGIASALNAVKGAAAKPINFVINTVWNNGLAKVINAIPGVPNVGMVKPIPGYRKGGHTGYGQRDQSAGEVHHREYVWTAEETEKAGGPQGMERIKNYVLGSFRTGGYVRKHPVSSGIGTTYPGHTGRDFGRAYNSGYGTTVRAAGDGLITNTAKLATSYGWHIRQRLDEGLNAVYAHLSHIGVSRGQRVTAGQPIGRVGNTGRSYGAHLHFGINESSAATAAFLQGAAVTKASMGAGGDGPGPGLLELLNVPGKIAGLLGSLKTGLTSPWGKLIKGGISDALGKAKDWIIEKLTGGSTTGSVDRSGSPLRRYARGVRNAPRGAWWAGEDGPEIVQGRGGENVIPAPRSLALAQQVVGRGNGQRSQQDIDQLFERLIAAMESREAPQLTAVFDEGDIRRVVRSEIRSNNVRK